MTDISTRDELIEAGLAIVRERGLDGALPDFTVRELISRAGGPTRSAFQHAWPQRLDFEREVLENLLADRSRRPPRSITSITRALDLLESGPNLGQFTRAVYANAGGGPQKRDLRDRIAITCMATGESELADFAAQSETARYAQADMQFVQILRVAGMAFGFEPKPGYTFLDLAKIVGAITDGMLLQRTAGGDLSFDDHLWNDVPAWPLESILTNAVVSLLTVPIGDGYSVPSDRKPHPSEASRPVAGVAPPLRPPTTRSLFLEAGAEIVAEKGLLCALPSFTIGELLDRVSTSVTEGAFHHNWPRKAEFEAELMKELVAPDTIRNASTQADLTAMVKTDWSSRSQIASNLARQSLARPADQSFVFVSTLAASGEADPSVVSVLREGFDSRVEGVSAVTTSVGTHFGRAPTEPLTWTLLTRMSLAVTDGILLRAMVDPNCDATSLAHGDADANASLLGLAYEAIIEGLTEPI